MATIHAETTQLDTTSALACPSCGAPAAALFGPFVTGISATAVICASCSALGDAPVDASNRAQVSSVAPFAA